VAPLAAQPQVALGEGGLHGQTRADRHRRANHRWYGTGGVEPDDPHGDGRRLGRCSYEFDSQRRKLAQPMEQMGTFTQVRDGAAAEVEVGQMGQASKEPGPQLPLDPASQPERSRGQARLQEEQSSGHAEKHGDGSPIPRTLGSGDQSPEQQGLADRADPRQGRSHQQGCGPQGPVGQ
jgi:hypothetical protein